MKKFILFSLFVFSIFFFNPFNSFAATPSDLDIWLYFTDGTSTKCTDLNYCFTSNSDPLVNRVSIKTQSYSIIEGSKYDVYSSVKLWLLRDNLDIRNDFYIGNFSGNQWNNQSNVSWNNLDSLEYDSFGGFYILNWGLVQNFTSSFSSAGITWDFYFNNPTRLSRIEITRFELLNTGNTTADSINNMSNNIINNNNQNTQNIINSQNQINNSLNDDNVDQSTNTATDFFNNFDSGNTGTLTDIISLPLDFLDKLNDTCSPITLPVPHMGNITLPCIQSYLSTFLPESFLNLIILVVNGFFMYKIIISLVDFINSLKDPNNNDLEVIDL